MYVIYGRDGCPFCTEALEIIRNTGEEYEYRDTRRDPKAKAFLDDSGFRKVPQIFHNQKHIGGCDKLRTYVSNNDYDPNNLF